MVLSFIRKAYIISSSTISWNDHMGYEVFTLITIQVMTFLKMETARSSKMLVSYCITTQHCEDNMEWSF